MKRLLFCLAANTLLAGTPLLAQAAPGAKLPPPGSVPMDEYTRRTVVVYNKNVPDSKALADHYMAQRGIPGDSAVALDCAKDETILRSAYKTSIELPLQEQFTKRGWWKVEVNPEGKMMCMSATKRVIVLMHGVPLRMNPEPVDGNGKPTTVPPAAGQENAASVDSELMALGLLDHPLAGPLQNPYFKQDALFFSQPLAPIFIVGRIDGPTLKDCKRLIDDAIAVEKTGLWGRVYIDLAQKNQEGYKMGEEWLINAAQSWSNQGFPVVMDVNATTYPLNYPMQQAAIYLGWYTLPADGPFLNPEFRFKRGAVACHIHSFSATSVRNPKEGYVAPFVTKGAAIVPGNVWEPYLGLTVHLDILSDRLLKGYTAGEAALMASVGLSWMNIVVGDPLYRPFSDKLTLNKEDEDYVVMRQAIRKHTATNVDDRKPFLAMLAKAASERRSSAIYEALASYAMGVLPDEDPKINEWFEAAAQQAKAPADIIRIRLVQAEYLRRTSRANEGKKLLEGAAKQFAKAPEAAAITATLTSFK